LAGEVVGFLGLFSKTPDFYDEMDATRLVTFADQAAVALKNAGLYAELAARNQELDAFAHTVAHDLKAPLSNILGHAHLLGVIASLDEESQEFLDGIQSTALHMGDMIDQLLHLAQLRDTIENVCAVNMQDVVSSAVSRFQSQLIERGVVLHRESDLPPALGHGPWLEEVFANLVGNAIKYIGEDNPSPSISISGHSLGDQVRYEVTDNGLGITPEDQERLFEMFARFHHGEAKGLGLGLSIAKRITQNLNGEIGVESVPGEGSTFWFILPAARLGDSDRQPGRKRT
jgi:signal transduction histidine kinase